VLLDLSQLATHFTEKFLWGPTVPLGDVIIKIDMKKKQNINNTCNLLFMASLLVSNHKISRSNQWKMALFSRNVLVKYRKIVAF